MTEQDRNKRRALILRRVRQMQRISDVLADVRAHELFGDRTTVDQALAGEVDTDIDPVIE